MIFVEQKGKIGTFGIAKQRDGKGGERDNHVSQIRNHSTQTSDRCICMYLACIGILYT